MELGMKEVDSWRDITIPISISASPFVHCGLTRGFAYINTLTTIPRLQNAVESLILANDTFLEITWPIVETTARREQTGDIFVDMDGVISVLPQQVAHRKS